MAIRCGRGRFAPRAAGCPESASAQVRSVPRPPRGPGDSARRQRGRRGEAWQGRHSPAEVLRLAGVDDTIWTLDSTGGTDSLPGSGCYFKTKTPGTAYTQHSFAEEEVQIGYVAIGYGLSDKEWNELVAYRCANGGSQPPDLWIPSSALNGHGTKKALTLGAGSKAFALDFDLVASDEALPESFPQFPSDFYVVSVHTRNDVVLSVAVYGGTLEKTEALVHGILVSNPKF